MAAAIADVVSPVYQGQGRIGAARVLGSTNNRGRFAAFRATAQLGEQFIERPRHSHGRVR